jgi:hypothetical protein
MPTGLNAWVRGLGLSSRALEIRPARAKSARSGIIHSVLILAALALAGSPAVRAQKSEAAAPSPVPILSGGTSFVTSFQGGDPDLHPLVSPVLLVPFGDRWLFEVRATFETDLTQPLGSSDLRGKVRKEVDYAQLDFIVNRYLTISAGRYLTPFGIFNERLYPVWIRDLQSDPLILPIGVGPSNAGTGVETRGGFQIHRKVNLNYAAYFSTLVTTTPVDSSRFAGGRVGLFLPDERLEFGTSFQHLLQDDRSNSFGFHFAWQPPPIPLDVRGEYARSKQGSGYWIESAYRLSQIPVWHDVLRKMQVVARMQQYFTGLLPSDALPPINTQVFEFGVNYYFRDDLRAVSSYGRQFTAQGNQNVWTIGVTYRFVMPLVPGASNR